MRKPDTIERLYLDFDGFFASVEQQAKPALRNKPIGIVPFDGTHHTCVIACSKEAKKRGCSNVMSVRDAKTVCPELILVPQNPDLYRRAHNALVSEIGAVIPIDAIKSIDELTCKLTSNEIRDPAGLSHKIKTRIHDNVGQYITCSIGLAANRQLAKIAGKMNKPDGTTIWHPHMLPEPLFSIPFEDIPGIGKRMERRLVHAGIYDMRDYWHTNPKHMRKLWRSVTGEKLWYALHGYDVQAIKTQRGMIGHGRVLPPDLRSLEKSRDVARLLLVKAARRLRRAGYYSSRLAVWLSTNHHGWSRGIPMPIINDDQACLSALNLIWNMAKEELPRRTTIFRVGVTLMEISPATHRQLDFLLNDDVGRKKWEQISSAIDNLNTRYGRTLVSIGQWQPPSGGNAGGKISYTRIPKAEDFW